MTSDRHGEADTVEKALAIFEPKWSSVIIREAMYGVTRFNEFERRLGISRPILVARLRHLVDAGLLERIQYRTDPDRYEYRLTEMGREFYRIVIALYEWGRKFLEDGDPIPKVLRHKCGEPVNALVTCSSCGEEVQAQDVTFEGVKPRTAAR